MDLLNICVVGKSAPGGDVGDRRVARMFGFGGVFSRLSPQWKSGGRRDIFGTIWVPEKGAVGLADQPKAAEPADTDRTPVIMVCMCPDYD